MKRFLKILILAVAFNCSAEPTVPPFESGERVAFIGDSITHGGMYRPYIQAFYATRFPGRNVVTFNIGVAGDTVKGGSERTALEGEGLWESDVRRFRPTAAVIMLGMNDAGSAQFESCKTPEELERKNLQRVGWYRDGYGSMLDHLEAQGIQSICLISPSPYDQTMVDPAARKNLVAFGTGKNDLIVRMAREVIDVEAAERQLPVVDFNTPLLEINAQQQAVDPAFSIIGKDRVHPGEAGHMVMAYTFLKAQGLKGPVARVGIDAKNAGVISSQNCSVGKPEKTAAGVRFEYTAESLPFPRAPYRSVAGLIPFAEEFNRETLAVQGLDAGEYDLKIDDVSVGLFSAEQLNAGINMARLDRAPQVIQADTVWDLCRERARLASKSRNIVWSDNRLRKVEGLDRSDIEACRKEVVRILETDPSLIPYTKGLLEDYLENVEHYHETFAELEMLAAKMYEAARPETRWIEVSRDR